MVTTRQHLLFDADDTLWENASFFAAALTEFARLMQREGVSIERSQALFTELEGRGFRRRWYGGRRLSINLRAAARVLLGPEAAQGLSQELESLGRSVSDHDMRVLDGVPETLEALAPQHQLILVTMGESREQRSKIERSGLAEYFEEIHILHDKTRSAYESIVRRHRLDLRQAWMIGNSLAKDIKPARAAGLNTIHFSNGQEFSFGLATEDIRADQIVRTFRELNELFALKP